MIIQCRRCNTAILRKSGRQLYCPPCYLVAKREKSFEWKIKNGLVMSPGVGRGNGKGLLTERFWVKVQKTETCWLWVGASHKAGYGALTSAGINCTAHRVSWELHNGRIPEGLQVLHKCEVRNCVKPEHLFLGTQKANIHDMLQKGRHRTQSKLKVAQVIEIRRRLKCGDIQRVIARKFNIAQSTVSQIASAKTWRHVL